MVRNIFILLLIGGILGGIYYYSEIYQNEPGSVNNPESLPEYILLENTDTVKYQAIVMYNYNVNINSVAKTFYNSNIFWPYIFIENKAEESVRRNPLDIPKGIVLRIPKLAENEANLIDTVSVRKARELADSILNTVSLGL